MNDLLRENLSSQIDLLIVRKDQVINVCEMKYTDVNGYVPFGGFIPSSLSHILYFKMPSNPHKYWGLWYNRCILDIYGYYVTNTAVSFEYEIPSEEDFCGRIENTLKKYPYLVAEEDG